MKKSNRQRRPAFTLLELFVVVLIIGILLAMFLPFARTTREAARRTTCLNNIRQLSLGILNYESAYQHLPPATGIVVQEIDQLPQTADSYSGFLSFFRFTSRYSGHYFDKELTLEGVTYPAYPDVHTTGYPLWSEQRYGFLCPNVPVPESEFGSIHYAFSIGDIARNVHTPNAIRGAFAVGRTQMLAEVADGTSNTIGLVEIGGIGERSTGRRFAINQSSRFLDRPSLTSELVANSNNYKSSVELSETLRGGNWADGTGGPGLATTILPPGSPTVLVAGDSAVDGFFSASVNHPGGTIVSFCDGSGHFIDRAIDVGNQEQPSQNAQALLGIESHYGVWGGLGSSRGAESVEGMY